MAARTTAGPTGGLESSTNYRAVRARCRRLGAATGDRWLESVRLCRSGHEAHPTAETFVVSRVFSRPPSGHGVCRARFWSRVRGPIGCSSPADQVVERKPWRSAKPAPFVAIRTR